MQHTNKNKYLAYLYNLHEFVNRVCKERSAYLGTVRIEEAASEVIAASVVLQIRLLRDPRLDSPAGNVWIERIDGNRLLHSHAVLRLR